MKKRFIIATIIIVVVMTIIGLMGCKRYVATFDGMEIKNTYAVIDEKVIKIDQQIFNELFDQFKKDDYEEILAVGYNDDNTCDVYMFFSLKEGA